MKIKRFILEEYGPLKKITIIPSDFECIFGANESGKTAIVEALSHVLFKRNPAGLRYGRPEHITIELEENGTVSTLPDQRQDIELPPADVANLLYVQASESLLYEPRPKEQDDFWEEIKILLSKFAKGVSFARLDEQIFKTVGLTPRRAEWVEEKEKKIDAEVKRETELKKYLARINEIENKEIELSEVLEKSQTLKKEAQHIKEYKNYKNYKELASLYSTYIEKRTALQEYERYKYEYADAWQELELKKKTRQSAEKKSKAVIAEITTLEKEVTDLERKREFIESEDLKACLAKFKTDISVPQLLYPGLLLIIATTALVVSFFVPAFRIPAFPIFAFSCVLFIILWSKKRTITKLLREKETWLTKARKVFPDITDFSHLAKRIEEFERKVIEKLTILHEKKKQSSEFNNGQTLTEIDNEIGELRNKTGVAEVSDLRKKIEKKRELEGEKNELYGKLSGMLSEQDDKKWERMIAEVKAMRPEKEPDLTRERDIEHDLEKMQEKIANLTSEISIFRNVLKENFNITDDRTAFVELDNLQKKLLNYEFEKRAALAARAILKKMSSELDEFIQDIVAGDDSLSEYFRNVTERYDEVEIQDKNFVVKQKDGTAYKINQLSSGAQDQLLLCFRIAALKKVYPEGSFLILDDAFIFADWNRRRKLVGLLRKFIEGGNQVIYLTSDDHTRDILKDHGAHITTL